MNIFVLDNDIKKCAEYHCDKHVIKMILEYAQLLSGSVRLTTNLEVGYKLTHVNHPCALWVRESLSNWLWLREMSGYLNLEYMKRYNSEVSHKSYEVIKSLPLPNIKDVGLTPFKLVMPEIYYSASEVEAYRNYYLRGKRDVVKWRLTTPKWYN